MHKKNILRILSVILLAAMFSGCAMCGFKSLGSTGFKAPEITLSYTEIPYYTGFWYFSDKVTPTKGKAGNYGAPIQMSFIFEVYNPNDFPVIMENINFSIWFEEFELNRVSAPDPQWIPAGKTNQVRVSAILDARSALLSLMVTGGFELQEKGMSSWEALEKWWTNLPDFAFPVNIKGGSAEFSDGNTVKVVPFEAALP
jgi:hypothetical protein